VSDRFTRWKARQRVSSSHLNEAWDYLIDRSAMPMDGIFRTLGIDETQRPVVVGIGVTVDSGPASEADYTDARYWVQIITIDNTGGTTEDDIITKTDLAPMTAEDGGADIPTIKTATNASEWMAGSHTVPIGTLVIFFGFIDSANDTANMRYIFAGPAPADMKTAKLTVNSGAMGTKTTTSTWTYDATDIYGNSLGTNLSPAVPRENGTFGSAAWGWGYMAPDGSGFVLVKAEEVRGTSGCPT